MLFFNGPRAAEKYNFFATNQPYFGVAEHLFYSHRRFRMGPAHAPCPGNVCGAPGTHKFYIIKHLGTTQPLDCSMIGVNAHFLEGTEGTWGEGGRKEGGEEERKGGGRAEEGQGREKAPQHHTVRKEALDILGKSQTQKRSTGKLRKITNSGKKHW